MILKRKIVLKLLEISKMENNDINEKLIIIEKIIYGRNILLIILELNEI